MRAGTCSHTALLLLPLQFNTISASQHVCGHPYHRSLRGFNSFISSSGTPFTLCIIDLCDAGASSTTVSFLKTRQKVSVHGTYCWAAHPPLLGCWMCTCSTQTSFIKTAPWFIYLLQDHAAVEYDNVLSICCEWKLYVRHPCWSTCQGPSHYLESLGAVIQVSLQWASFTLMWTFNFQ